MEQLSPVKPKAIFNKKRAVILSLIIAIIGAIFIYRSFASTILEPPQGLFIQVSSLSSKHSPQELQTWLESVRKDHRSKDAKSGNPNPGYINDLVLQDISDKNGRLLTEYLDVIAPYLPGGSKKAFDRVFVGTIDLPWEGTGSKYIEGINDPNFRYTNLNQSETLAKLFKQKYPTVPINWYITYEANLAGFWSKSIEDNYSTYINSLGTKLNTIQPNATFMWSPAFWTTHKSLDPSLKPDLKINMNHLFSNFKYPMIINLQDFVGQSNGSSTKEDAVEWVNYLKTNITKQPKAITMNTEQFIQKTDGSIVVGDSTEVPTRANYYNTSGIKLGPSWEIRYWYKRLSAGTTQAQ